jgi:hypothetical protein
MVNKKEYMEVPCLEVPKLLFHDNRYKELTTTAKMLYSLLLDRHKYAALNGWVDEEEDIYVMYPKNDMINDLNCSRYGVDQAILELERKGLVMVVLDNGRPNRFYLTDITELEEENETMMRAIDEILAAMTTEEKIYLLEKFEETANMLAEGLAAKGYPEAEKNESADKKDSCTCEACDMTDCEDSVQDDDREDSDLHSGGSYKEAIKAEAKYQGMKLALNIIKTYDDTPVKLMEIQNFLSTVYEERPKKAFLSAIEALAMMTDAPDYYVGYSWISREKKKYRTLFLAEFISGFDELMDKRLENF